jgi:drug/metabolite transporter (DMT)-like permease
MPSASLDPFVFVAVLAAAAMHAGWNAFLKLRLDPLSAMTLIAACSGLIGVPFLAWFGWPRTEAWPWLLASLALHIGYYITLTEAYRRADMSQIYPIARGGAPLLTAAASLIALREPVSPPAVVGIAVLGAGVALMSLRGSRKHQAIDPIAIAFALGTAVIICGYTLVDGIGARTAGDPHAYATALFVLDGVPLLLFIIWRDGLAGVKPLLRFGGPGLIAGTLSFAAYWIAIWAMTVAPIALVAALRETSVLFAAVIAFVFLKEPFGPIRAVAAVLIVGGLLLIRM